MRNGRPSAAHWQPEGEHTGHDRSVTVLVDVVLLGSLFVLLLPILSTGWLWDDGLNFNFRPAVEYERDSFFAYATQGVRDWMDAGRFYPILFYQGNAVFYLIRDVVAYKWFLLVLTMLTVVAVTTVVKYFTKSTGLAVLSFIGFAACIQLRDYHDPLLAYEGHIQILIIQFAIGLIVFDRWLITRGLRWLAGTAALFLVACLTYELAYVLCLLFVPVLFLRPLSWRMRVTSIAPLFGISAALIGVGLYLRLHASRGGTSYQPSFDLPLVASTYAKQLVGTFPASSQLVARGPETTSLHGFLSAPIAVLLVAVLLAGIALLLVLRERVATDLRPFYVTVAIGALLVVTPPLPLAIAPKYQAELKWGWAYLPVLIQISGLVIGASGALGLLLSARIASRRFLRPVVSGVVALGVLLSIVVDGANSVHVARGLNFTKSAISAQETAIRDGLFDAVPEGSRIYAENYWATKYFFFGLTGKRYEGANLSDPGYKEEPVNTSACTGLRPAAYVFVINGQGQPVIVCLGPGKDLPAETGAMP